MIKVIFIALFLTGCSYIIKKTADEIGDTVDAVKDASGKLRDLKDKTMEIKKELESPFSIEIRTPYIKKKKCVYVFPWRSCRKGE